MRPVRVKIIDGKKLFIEWADETESEIGLEYLRKHCPCATCLTEREKQSRSYIPILTKSQVRINNISQVGSYALGITWDDGHNTGIYEYPFLKKLAD